MCYLHYTADSGVLPGGQKSRTGDEHNQVTLLQADCLPRLIDSCLAQEAPDVHMQRSWQRMLSPSRLESEKWLGYTPDSLRRFWVSAGQRGRDTQKLFQVGRDTEEFSRVVQLFQ